LLATATAAAQPTLTPEMLVDLIRVTDAAIDPNATRIAFILQVPRAASEKRGAPHTELWVIQAAGGAARRYSAAGEDASAPAFSPDGRRLAFLSKGEGEEARAQIHAVDLDGGAPSSLTSHDSSILDFRWSPDGRSIAFVAADPKSEEEEKSDETGRDWIVHDENLKQRRLYVIDAAGGKSRRLFDRDLSIWDFEWAHDGKTILIQSTDLPRTDESYMFRRISAVQVDGGKQTVAFTTEGKLGPMEVSPDGRTLAFLGAATLNDPIAQSVYIVPLTGGTPRNLVADHRASAVDLAWLDARNLLVLVNEGATTRLVRINAETGARVPLGESAEIIHSLDVAPAKGRFAAVAETIRHPSEVYAGNVSDGRLTRLTQHNRQLDDVRLARQEVFRWTSADGWSLEGVLTYPLNYSEGRRYPLVLQIHGGPEGISQQGWTTSAIYPVQLLAADGYFVLQPNYRGSGGLGVAFSKADHDDLGGKEYDDVLRGIDALAAKGLVDANRVATGGFSYGGYFSAWGATRYSERFKAAIVGAGISNWISFTGTTDIPYEMSLVHWNSWWFDQPALHWERSPLAHINKAKTPTLIIHGAKDERVHPEQSLELYTALRLKKVPTEYVLYPREPHGIRERAHQLDVIARVRAWLKKYL
jgi:dipeptidyl aminopeptidase/acylaminoacyl peptidase